MHKLLRAIFWLCVAFIIVAATGFVSGQQLDEIAVGLAVMLIGVAAVVIGMFFYYGRKKARQSAASPPV